MTVKELIEELHKYPSEMEIVDSIGDSFDELHYKRVYDSFYPYEEIEHIALCLDFKDSYHLMDLGELKDIIKCQMYDYPDMYNGDDWIERLLNNSKEFDEDLVKTGWEYWGKNKLDKPIFKLISYRNLNA